MNFAPLDFFGQAGTAENRQKARLLPGATTS